MAFNRAQFNTAPYNNADGEIRFLIAVYTETVFAFVGSSVKIYNNIRGNERITCEAEGAPTRFASGSISEEVTQQASGLPIIYLTADIENEVSSDCEGIEIICPKRIRYNEKVVHRQATMHFLYFANCKYKENVRLRLGSGTQSYGDRYYASPNFVELVNTIIDVSVAEQKSCIINVTLHPGQKLVIDAESYNVLLDGENAINLHKGDWIDELDRSTSLLTIRSSSGTANLSASVIYTEKYL